MKEFEDYLKQRIELISKEYSSLLTKIGENTDLINEENNSMLWKEVDDKKSRIEELKMMLEFFK